MFRIRNNRHCSFVLEYKGAVLPMTLWDTRWTNPQFIKEILSDFVAQNMIRVTLKV